MASFDNSYSRLVAWLKVLLPLTALAILSTLFLVSQRHDPEATLPYSDGEVEEILREQSIVAPRYSGVTSDGAAVSLTAVRARPDSGHGAGAEALRMQVELPDGGSVLLTASDAHIDMQTRRARMSGGVRIETSTGYTVESDTVISTLDTTRIETDGAVAGTAPFGDLQAGALLIERTSGASEDHGGGTYVLMFTGGVDLIYDPKQHQGDKR